MEQVWVLPRTVLFEIVPQFQGFLDADTDLASFAQALEGAGEFRPRDSVEEDPSLKQIIPYVSVRHDERYLQLRRLKTQGEARLHDRLSIGVGGHVNPEVEDGRSLLLRGLERELHEELVLEPPVSPIELLGFVNDDSNAVGSVHFGVACRLEIDHPVEIRERDRMTGEWRTIEELHAAREQLESWSSMMLDALR